MEKPLLSCDHRLRGTEGSGTHKTRNLEIW